MIGEALEITIVVSMLVLVVYPSSMMVMEALQEGEIPIHLSVAKDGVEGLAFLHREGNDT